MSEFIELAVANDRRRTEGAIRTVAVLTRYFAQGDTTGATEEMLIAGRARLAHPDDSLVQVARRLGVTKDTLAGRLRRLEDLASARNHRDLEAA